MSNVIRRIIAAVGIAVGLVIIVIGINCVNTYVWTEPVGDYIQFGADFYTEMYSVTREVGSAINNNTDGLAKVCEAIGWLIVSIGLIDVIAFVYLLCAPKQKTYKKVFGASEENPGAVQGQPVQPAQPYVQPVTYAAPM